MRLFGIMTFLIAFAALAEDVPDGMAARTDERLQEAIMNKIEQMERNPYNLTADVRFNKLLPLKKRLVFGKDVEPVVSQLTVMSKQKTPQAEEAKAILASVAAAKQRIEERIERAVKIRPGVALLDIGEYSKTWPRSASRYAELKKTLSAKPEIITLRNAALLERRFDDMPPQRVNDAKKQLPVLVGMKAKMEDLKSNPDEAISNDARVMIKHLNERIGICERAAQPVKR